MPYHRKRMVIEILEGLFKQPPIAATATPAPPGIVGSVRAMPRVLLPLTPKGGSIAPSALPGDLSQPSPGEPAAAPQFQHLADVSGRLPGQHSSVEAERNRAIHREQAARALELQ